MIILAGSVQYCAIMQPFSSLQPEEGNNGAQVVDRRQYRGDGSGLRLSQRRSTPAPTKAAVVRMSTHSRWWAKYQVVSASNFAPLPNQGHIRA